ncbi:hypothetical protein [uncultured Gimesia sp.]|mgnify:CR=1 FL=1|uniref:hypothetical protein n=1 Tax=uncultured Gimesia sp. TaxID=1678688 RepID=UPI0030DBE0A7|tara:strand:+ start:298 stop:1635 length:1338 start_codon:yes stop_codon:yes gene_type:complete
MDSWQLAVRRYLDILPQMDKPRSEFPKAKLKAWLRNDACPVIEEYSQRLRFRECANWPLTTLMPGAETSERQIIDSLEQVILECAKTLTQLTKKKLVRKYLEDQNPSREYVSEETIEITAGETTCVKRRIGNSNDLEIVLSQVEYLSQISDLSLVNSSDYFAPVQEFSKDVDEKKVQRGELIIAFNYELDPVGNYMIRCLLERARQWYELLSKARCMIKKAIKATGRPYQLLVDQLENEWKKLEADWSECQHLLKSGFENRLRNSAVVLTQIYAAYGLKPELDWLSLPDKILNHGIESIRSRLTTFLNKETTDRVTHALSDMKDLYGKDEQQTDAVEKVIASGGLVLIRDAGKVYWKKKIIFHKLSGISWKFLYSLAKKAKYRAPVTEKDLYPNDSVSKATMSTNWKRLGERLPDSLVDLVRPGIETRSYILRLDSSKIHIFEKW